jgi:hypothetical protein
LKLSSAHFPKFAIRLNKHLYANFGKLMGTRKFMIFVPLIDLKSLNEFAACGAGTSDRRYEAHGEHTGDVKGIAVGAVLDLVPARGAVGDNQRIGVASPHGRQ